MDRGRVLVVLVASVSLSGCWLQPDYDGGHTRWNPREEAITPANVASLAARWSVDFPGRTDPQPLISGGRVLVQRQDGASVGVLALDAATGATLWDRDVSPPEATNDFANFPATIIEGEVWQDWQGSIPGNSCASGTVRLGQDGTFLGEDRSSFAATVPMQSGRYLIQLRWACPFPNPGPRTLEVSDSRTREVLWRTAPATIGDVTVSGDLLITSFGIYALAGCGAPTCGPVRTIDVGFHDRPIVAGPRDAFFVVKPGFGGPNGQVHAFSRTTGARTWSLNFNAVQAELAVDDEFLYVATSNGNDAGYLLVYDVDGCGAANCWPVWSARAATSAWAPTVAGDVVYVAGNDGRVHAFRANGCGFVVCGEIGSVAVPGGNIVSLAVADGRLVASSQVTLNSRYRLTALTPS